MSRRTRYFLFISFVALSIFMMVGLGSTRAQDWPFDAQAPLAGVRNLSGPLGSLLAYWLFAGLGRLFAWLAPAGLIVLGVGLLVDRSRASIRLLLKSLLVVVLLVSFFAMVPFTRGHDLFTGGLGKWVAGGLAAVLGEFGGAILLITCLLLVLLADVRLGGRTALDLMERASAGRAALTRWATAMFRLAGQRITNLQARIEDHRARSEAQEWEDVLDDGDTPESAQTPGEAPWIDVGPQPSIRAGVAAKSIMSGSEGYEPPASAQRTTNEGIPLEKAKLPPLSILGSGNQAGSGYSSEQLRGWSDVLEGKLSNYGIEGRVTAVNQGPVVTTFEFEPAPGVKVKEIVSRSDDLALAMRARSLRLIAPIPGRAVVGIEIPNPDHNVVYFRDVLREIPERLRYSGIMIALGVDAIGKPFHMNLCGAPHLLMAGTTGSGKSVALNGFLASILFQYRPSDVRLLIIDPKMVEMSVFNGIPHLLHPVITDPREAVRIFSYLISEMERRNHLLRRNGVKNIESFNSKIGLGKEDPEGENERLPYIVLVIDELADLVLTKGIDFESLLSRLSNMARAVGIHMTVATQRPSVDVIDGKTKANFPTRIAFRVASKVDSRTILDCMGAEKLLGYGDMLYVDAKHPEALRLHGSWLSEDELEELVDHWKQYDFEESHLQLFEETKEVSSGETRDSYFEEAKDVVIRHRQGSTSLLQRKLHVGYARAARILDQLEDAGIVGPPEGSKPREVLVLKQHEVAPNANDLP